MRFVLYMLSILVGLSSCNNKESSQPSAAATSGSTLFKLLSAAETGIHFKNQVSDEENFNILTYRNYYNGGGVAIGDINNDSLPDLFFTANKAQNKLYLNKGNFVFEDITARAGVGGTKAWSTGVTMADVNGDGLLDIYVCNSGDVDGLLRENELFINNGDMTFAEKAASFNLDNQGYSTHAAFFDYDIDGDLDCYILNNSFKDPAKIDLYKKTRQQASAGGNKLMRNDGSAFTDVTTTSGIYSSEIGFGLGVAISDVNNDHLPDIYISNDFWERDYLYINKGKGKFSEELIKRINYCSTSSMGADIADINNDGNMEIFTTDMLPADNYRLKTTITFDPYHLEDLKYRANFHYQMTQNCLHLNNGEGMFQEIALLSGVAATDWSWGALVFDFENDGYKDIFVSNGILKDIMSMDFREFIADSENRDRITATKGKFDYRNFISYMPSKKLSNYAFHNNRTLFFQNRADSLGLAEPSFSNGSAYGDLDNDGDLDLVVNNINSPCFVYRNETDKAVGTHFLKIKFNGSPQNRLGIGSRVTIKTRGGIKTLENYNTRGFQSSIEPLLLFGLGNDKDIEELKVVWPDRKTQVLYDLKADRSLTLRYTDASASELPVAKASRPQFIDVSKQALPPNARHVENAYNDFNFEILLTRMVSTEGPRTVTGDINRDNLDDFILLGASGDPDKVFIQQQNGTFKFKPSVALANDAAFESTCGALFDHDLDGDLDLMIGSGGNEIEKSREFFMVRYYKNDGHGNFTADPMNIPPVIGNFSTLETDDFDKDGDIDVFLGARVVPGNYGLPPRSFLLINEGGSWVDMATPSIANPGMVTDASWADVDGDGDNDLVVVGDWMAVSIFENKNGSIQNQKTIANSKGWWNRIQPADLDKDGDTDFVLGNWGLNTKFKASASEPVTMFVNDFDKNGKSEFIINWFAPLDDSAYPFSTKQELTSQLPALRKSILKYADYSNKRYDSLFPPQILKQSIAYEVNYLETAILWNEGGNYELVSLPTEAQVSPVFAIVADDLDEDGKTDIWLGGNFYALKPQVGRHDASKGIFLKGSGDKKFVYQDGKYSGLSVDGEVRDASLIDGPYHSRRILVARNNSNVLLFDKQK
jgi:enediyne biosynthesis protein E4